MLELESRDYGKALPLLRRIHINTLFAEAVLEGQMPGKVYTDCLDRPQAFYVAHPYGMSLLFGETGDEVFTRELYDYLTNQSGQRQQAEWLQADPAGEWTAVLDDMLTTHSKRLANLNLQPAAAEAQAIQRNVRVNFRFSQAAFLEAKSAFVQPDGVLVRTGLTHYLEQPGSVVPRFFWRDEAHFAAEGVGYTLMKDGEIASTAFSSCRTPTHLEIGIETAEGHRGHGYAFAVCSALIDYCLEHGLEPVWACRLENEGSYVLAQKLGFQPTVTLPYYRLPA